MNYENNNLENQTPEENAKLIIDFFHRISMHHAIWFAEVSEKLGKVKAYEILDKVYKQSYDVQMKRLSKIMGFEMKDSLPSGLTNLPNEKLLELREGVALNWLANDGIWFQAIEFSSGMADAKHCNDASWAQFAPFEAWSIKRNLNLTEFPGLDGLKQALKMRMYSFINKQSVIEETANSFVFQMDDCRVQSTRKRKGLDDYPCKSAGIIEFPEFAKAIDSRIKTECVCCPPDEHPESHFCAWKFSIDTTFINL
jgi:hypothetical protein